MQELDRFTPVALEVDTSVLDGVCLAVTAAINTTAYITQTAAGTRLYMKGHNWYGELGLHGYPKGIPVTVPQAVSLPTGLIVAVTPTRFASFAVLLTAVGAQVYGCGIIYGLILYGDKQSTDIFTRVQLPAAHMIEVHAVATTMIFVVYQAHTTRIYRCSAYGALQAVIFPAQYVHRSVCVGYRGCVFYIGTDTVCASGMNQDNRAGELGVGPCDTDIQDPVRVLLPPCTLVHIYPRPHNTIFVVRLAGSVGLAVYSAGWDSCFKRTSDDNSGLPARVMVYDGCVVGYVRVRGETTYVYMTDGTYITFDPDQTM